ncbi:MULTISPECIES: hypothetical protein [unclassified Archaeoglobus]|jgi:hypothetical protein|uniref:hypothetical protein n=1 Tax=unclassified Archaeoglobus TaxID=2643606 RepID=UPI0025BC6720|nr:MULTISPECIES: hypothetical protein [unclassified Archaeoglobus]
MFSFLYTPYPKTKDAIQDLKVKLEEVEFKPTLTVFFLTEELINDSEKFASLVDCESVCMPIEGYITPESIWTRGCLVLLTDAEYELQVFKGTPDEVVDKMRRAKKGRFNILIYPLLYPKSRLQALKILIRLRRLYGKYKSDPEYVLERASEIYQNELIYPINKMLRPFRDAGVDAVSFNIFPLRMKYGHPIIAVNGKKVGRGVVVLSFRERIPSDYTDTLPERGRNLEETKEIIKHEFMIGKEVKVEKKGIALGHIDGMKLNEFLEAERIAIAKRDLSNDLQDKKFLSASPYALYFLSKETMGASSLGLLGYPLEIYPSLFELDSFMDNAIFFAETIRGGLNILKKYFVDKNFNFYAIDHNMFLMYEEKIHQLKSYIPSYAIFTSYPNYTSHNLKIKLMSEIENKIYLNLTRTTLFINWI